MRVFHSLPSGIPIRRANCAWLVYGWGRSRTRYLAAFLSRRSEMITCGLAWSARAVGVMPGTALIRWGFGGSFLVPVPPQVPCG